MFSRTIRSALLVAALLPTACDNASSEPIENGGAGGKADEFGDTDTDGFGSGTDTDNDTTTGSASASSTYECHVFGHHEFDGEEADIEAEGIVLELDGPKMCMRTDEILPCQELPAFGGEPPWSLSLRTNTDGGERPMVLSLGAPTQNAAVGQAYAEPGSKYVGAILGSDLEALCKRVD